MQKKLKQMITHYFFDFGNVFINLDLESTTKYFEKKGFRTLTKKDLDIIHKYEKGLITTRIFTSYFQKLISNITTEYIVEAWNSILLDFPFYRLEFIENFCRDKQCFLLSNINELHLKAIKQKLPKDFYSRFINSFEKVYYSHEIHMRKPDKNIFDFVLKDNKTKAKNCFFVDDNIDNIKTANQMGFTTWHINPFDEDIVELESKNLFF